MAKTKWITRQRADGTTFLAALYEPHREAARLGRLTLDLVDWCDQNARHIDPTPLQRFSRAVNQVHGRHHDRPAWMPSAADLEQAGLDACNVCYRIVNAAILMRSGGNIPDVARRAIELVEEWKDVGRKLLPTIATRATRRRSQPSARDIEAVNLKQQGKTVKEVRRCVNSLAERNGWDPFPSESACEIAIRRAKK